MIRLLAPWLNGLTALELALVFCAFYIGITLLGIVLVHPLIRRMVHGKREVNDIVIFVAANFGLVYSVLLGLLIVATFQNTKDLQDHIATEASRLSTLYRGAESYPEALRSELRSQLRDYAHYVIEKDWPAHLKERVLVGGDHRLQAIRQALFSYELTTKPQEALHAAMLRYFNDMNVARERRLSAVSSSIPDVLWYVVIIGSVFTIVFLWMIHMDLIPQIILSGTTAIFLGLTTFLIYAMDHPLQAAVRVGPQPFQAAYDLTMKWDEGFGGETMASLGTGEVELVYYKVGGAICEVVNRDIRELGVRCSAESTPGSQYNVEAIHNGELEFGIVQSDIAYTAYNGKGTFAKRPFGDLRSVAVLYPEIVTVMVRSDSGIAKIADLAGRRINVGRLGSGTHAIWDDLQATLGWKDAQITEWPAEEAARALCTGKIDANFLQVGHPSRASPACGLSDKLCCGQRDCSRCTPCKRSLLC
jgi:hypothetical protein